MILDYLEQNKNRITSFLDTFFSAKRKELSILGDSGKDDLRLLQEFTERGKMIRGACATLGYSLFSDDPTEKVLPAAAAVELFQSALLIHDDIMDRDESRRGVPSLYYQYQQTLEEQSLPDTLHTGEALAIGGGDIAFFLGYELLSILRPPEVGRKIIEYASKELSNVAVAQMIDVRRGNDSVIPDEEDIIRLYRFKTGRYTFSFPLWMGAQLGGTEEKNLALLEKIGELLGILFQIKDDELGLFGEEQVLGKPVGSDLREGKKTLHLALLHRMASEVERQEILSISQDGEITDSQVKSIRDTADRLEIREYIETRYLQPFSEELKTLLEELTNTMPAAIKVLEDLIGFVVTRNK